MLPFRTQVCVRPIILHTRETRRRAVIYLTEGANHEVTALSTAAAWIILLILLVPIIGILIWVIIAASVVRVPSGSLGLLMVKGKATDTTLPPGYHFIFAFRRRIVEE